MPGLHYISNTGAQTVSAAQDLFELLLPSDAAGLVWELTISQVSDTDSEQLRVTVSRVTGAPTSGSGGGTITPTPLISGAPAAGSTVERNNTTQISGGTSATVYEESFNVLNGLKAIFDPPIEVAPSTRLVVAITAPADALTMSAALRHSEVGG